MKKKPCYVQTHKEKVFCTRRQQCSSSLFVFVFFLVLSVVRMDFSLFSSRGMVCDTFRDSNVKREDFCASANGDWCCCLL